MFGATGPAVLLTQSLQHLIAELPGLRDGQEAAIHQARVAIRRLREALALARSQHDEDDLARIEERLGRTFKALGRARDADTTQRLVQHVECRFPMAPATLGQLRASVARSRLRTRQKVVKTIEAFEIHRLSEQLHDARRSHPRFAALAERWRPLLRSHIAHRASDVRRAIDRAGGVYFRKRSHSARIAIKQLRYALEFADAAGVWRDARALRTLRKAQEALGQAHDREVLLQRLRDLEREGVAVNAGEVFALEQFIQGEINALHERYLAARPQVLDIATACEPRHTQHSLRRSALAVAAVALPAVLARRRFLLEP